MGDDVASATDRERIVDWMVKHVRSVLQLPEGDFPVEERFDTYGLDSVEAVIMAGLMEEEFGTPIDPMEMFEHPSVAQFAEFIAPRIANRPE